MNPFVEARKALVALSAAVGVAVTAGLVHGPYVTYIIGSIAAANAALVYYIPNGKPVPEFTDDDALSTILDSNTDQHYTNVVVAPDPDAQTVDPLPSGGDPNAT